MPDNLLLPDETLIYYSRSTSSLKIIGGVALIFVFIIYLFFSQTPDDTIRSAQDNKNNFSFLLIALAGVYFIYKGFRETRNSEPQIIINNKGIKTVETEFKPWSEISNEKIDRTYIKFTKRDWLVYDYFGGSERLNINSYDISKNELENLLIVYRRRSENNQNV